MGVGGCGLRDRHRVNGHDSGDAGGIAKRGLPVSWFGIVSHGGGVDPNRDKVSGGAGLLIAGWMPARRCRSNARAFGRAATAPSAAVVEAVERIA
jgi:hypothetical protein